MKKYERIVIGIDQSYQNTGVSIVCDGVLTKVRSIDLSKYKSNSKRRGALAKSLVVLISKVAEKSDNVIVICERARLHGGPTSFINIDAIKAMGALTAAIVDVCDKFDVEVYSVDTRCWKSQVVGTCRPEPNTYGVPEEKWPTVRWVIGQGFADSITIVLPENSRKTKGTFVDAKGRKCMYNNDAADSAGIAMFGFVGDMNKLEREK